MTATTYPSLPHPGSFLRRAVVAAVVAGGFAALCWADATGMLAARPAWWLAPLAVVVAWGGATEVVRMAAARGLRMRPLAVPAAAAILPLVPILAAAVGNDPVASMGWVALAVTAVLVMFFLVEIATYARDTAALVRLAAGFSTAAAVGLPLAFMVDLRLASKLPGPAGLVPLVSMLAVVKGGDIAAYVIGSLLGQHRMAPALSPGKTWEGAAASLAASLVIAWGLLSASGWATAWQPWGGWPVYGLAVGMAGMLGDLSESLVKRELAAKDSGRSLGALGGFLDLADATLLAAPVAWVLWVLGGPAG